MRDLITALFILMTLTACDGHPNSDPERIKQMLENTAPAEELPNPATFPDSSGVGGSPLLSACDASLTGTGNGTGVGNEAPTTSTAGE